MIKVRPSTWLFCALLFSICVAFATALFGQTNDLAIPPELLEKDIKDWQLNGVTALIILQVLGRAYQALRTGGGVVGLWNGIVFGANVPTTLRVQHEPRFPS